MWTCPKCERIFEKNNQPHSCHRVPLEEHFKNKNTAKGIFDYLVQQVNSKIGRVRIISLPCCVHLYGTYDFLAALPKKDKLEIRFALDHEISSPRLKICVPMSGKVFKNCFDLRSNGEIDDELMGWIKQSYFKK